MVFRRREALEHRKLSVLLDISSVCVSNPTPSFTLLLLLHKQLTIGLLFVVLQVTVASLLDLLVKPSPALLSTAET